MPRDPRSLSPKYARRLARGQAKGLSRSQARGHARAGEALIRPRREASPSDPQLERAYKAFRESLSITQIAREFGISRERFSRYMREQQLAERRGRTWLITDNRPKPVVIYSEGRRKEVTAAGLEQAQLAGAYWNDANAFLSDPDLSRLKPYVDRSVLDIKGIAHPLEVDPNGIYEAAHEGGASFEEIYKPTL
jgi:hypothetical protein